MSTEREGEAGVTVGGTAELAYGIAPDRHRLPAGTRVGAVRLQVSDLERSLEFYTETLGFRVGTRTSGRANLTAYGSDEVLVELVERPGAGEVPRRGRLGLYHFAILLPDRASLGRFVRHLTAIEARAGASDHLVSEALYLQDPDNLGIEVYADRPRAEWRHSGRQLSMATLPLDLDDLVAAAGEQEWTGMPAGTRIGHVHLHVGDLEQAADFYHDALGFDKVVWNYAGALFLSAGGYHHHLGVNTWAAGAGPAPDDEAKLLEWELLLPDATHAAATLESLRDAGYSVEGGPSDGVVADPWGTRLRIRTNPTSG